MEEMGLTAKLFETSSKLETASGWIERIAAGEEPNTKGIEVLVWAGHFLSEMDWTSRTSARATVGGGLAIQATSVRPTFYSALIRIAKRFQEAGMTTEDDIIKYLGALYNFLLSQEAPAKKQKKLNSAQYKLASTLLQEIAQSILVQLNNNGLPRSSSSLRDDWKSSGNDLFHLDAPAV